MIGLIYFIIIFGSTFIGAIAGIGGGVIIKPVLDVIGIHDVETIGFLSCCAVLTMSFYSTTKHVRNKTEFDKTMVLLTALGSVVGGLIGSNLFQYVVSLYPSAIVKGVQSVLLAILLIFVLCNMIFHFKTYHVKQKGVIIFIGLALGMLSSFLGIGGGPANVAVFLLFFSCPLKQAVIYSLATIVFAQLSTFCNIIFTSDITRFDLQLLWVVLPAAILGGMIGTKVNGKISEKSIAYIFNATVCVILCITFINAYRAFC